MIARRTALLVLGLFALQFTALALVQARRDAPTFDEVIYLASGTAAVVHRDLRLNVSHPPPPKVLAALPVLLAHPNVPRGEAWERADEFTYTDGFVRSQGRDRLRRVVTLSRVVPIAIGVLVGFACYALAAGLFGRLAGLVPAVLWFTTPLAVGHSHLDATDIPFTLAVLAAALATRRLLLRPRARTVALVAVATAGAMLTRNNGLILFGLLPFVVLFSYRPRIKQGLVAVLGACVLVWALVWACYRLVAPHAPDGVAGRELASQVEEARAPGAPLPGRAVIAGRWPLEYEAGVAYQSVVSNQASNAYLVGHAWAGRNWWYWPVTMPVKLPIGMIVALIGGAVFWRRAEPQARRVALVAAVVPAAALGLFVLLQPAPIGIRYLLPTLVLLLAIAPAGLVLRSRWGRVAAVALLAVQLGSLWRSHPHSLAWTAPPFRPGYRFTTDSNLDWGQDLWRLAAWSRGRQPHVDLFAPLGTRLADFPTARRLLDTPVAEVRGWVAVSATQLTAYRRQELAWLRAYCPVDTIGGSIVLYRFDAPPNPAPGPTMPADLCAGERVSRRVVP